MDRPPPPRRARPSPPPPPPPSAQPSSSRAARRPPRQPHPAQRQPAYAHHNGNPPARPRAKNRSRRRGNAAHNYGPAAHAAQHSPPPTVAVKIVVRRLPPTMSPLKFAEVADPAGAEKAVWRAFAPGSASATGAVKRLRQVTRYAVAYLAFGSMEDAVAFTEKFNGLKFQDQDGPPASQSQDFVARVERAPWQAVPPLAKRTRPLPLHGTIEQDPDYLQFVARLEDESKKELSGANALTVAQTSAMFPRGPAANLNDPQKKDASASGMSATTGKAGAVVVNGSELITPLMEDVRARRKERDQKKKTTKVSPRPPRGKARNSHVTDSSHKQQAEPPVKVTSSMRRKKQRERARALEMANAARKQEEMQSMKRKEVPLVDGKRGIGAGVETRHDYIEPRLTDNLPSYPKADGNPKGVTSGIASVMAKQNVSREESSRARSGRGGRPKALNMPVSSGAINDPIDSRASVRVLRKDLRNGR